MSFNEVIEELPRLTFEQRQIFTKAIELDDPPLSRVEEELVELRLAEHHLTPDTSISLEELKQRLRSH